jgi:D-proline reductase (dithiol) PrdB
MMKPAKDKLLASIFTNSPLLVNLWAKQADIVTHASTPWATPAEDILQGPIAVVTTAGVHLIGQPPYNMDDPEGDASFREISSSAPAGALTITHNYYDHRDADADINVVLPIERLKDLEAEGFIGRIAGRHFSFMGHILGSRLERLVGETAPAVAAEMKKDGIRAALLTPG